jgi:hypothetical protein
VHPACDLGLSPVGQVEPLSLAGLSFVISWTFIVKESACTLFASVLSEAHHQLGIWDIGCLLTSLLHLPFFPTWTPVLTTVLWNPF